MSIDALVWQKAIVKKIASNGADYAIALKENQPMLYEDAKLYFDEFRAEMEAVVTSDNDHGRAERREHRLLPDVSWLECRKEWKGLKALRAGGLAPVQAQQGLP